MQIAICTNIFICICPSYTLPKKATWILNFVWSPPPLPIYLTLSGKIKNVTSQAAILHDREIGIQALLAVVHGPNKQRAHKQINISPKNKSSKWISY